MVFPYKLLIREYLYSKNNFTCKRHLIKTFRVSYKKKQGIWTQSFRTVCWEKYKTKDIWLSLSFVPQKQHESPPDMQVYICLCQTIAYVCV